MNDIVKRLESSIKDISDLIDATNRFGNKDLSIKLFFKKYEDGLIDKVCYANNNQVEIFITSFKFNYYIEYNNDVELLKSVIRNKKLEKLLY